jgi:hypothetical protein
MLSTVIATLALAAASSFFQASRYTLRDQDVRLETAQAARSTLDLLLRDLRLGGACLPVTGTFVTLEGVDGADSDEIVSRTGLTRDDLSCIRSASVGNAAAGTVQVVLENVDGLASGTRAYIRHPNGAGQFFTVASVDPATKTVTSRTSLAVDYPPTSGVYGLDERRFSVDTTADPPVLKVQLNDEAPMPFAVGIARLELQYELHRNCPSCDIVDLPASNAEWSIVNQIVLTVSARSARTMEDGTYYTKSLTVRVKPRNLLPR